LLVEVVHLFTETRPAALLGGALLRAGCTFSWLRIAGHNPPWFSSAWALDRSGWFKPFS